MRKLLLLLGLCAMQTPQAQDLHKNVAYADNHVRFTVISDGAVRMEYAPDGQFVDTKSFVAVQRAYPAADYRVKRGAWIEIATPKMVLRYRKNSGPFTASNLSVCSPKGAAVPFVWKPGMQQKGNLKGTYRTLDGYDGDTYVYDERRPKMPIEDGLLATDGWTLIDDSDNFLFDGDKEWEWVEKRPDDGAQDWYFLAYGHDYKAALRDFTLFAGKMPLPPRYAFGYWWSRYWAYSDKELRTLVKNFRAYDIPLDVLVIDMDWHYTDGDRGGWTGWSWNRTLFPDPAKFLRWLDGEGIRSTFNLHPADGVRCGEDSYADVARDMGIDPASKQTVPWVSSDKKFIRSIFRRILTPMERDGVDFWWLDWQQHLTSPYTNGLGQTFWCNHVFYNDMAVNRPDNRPVIFHRWGGLGSHRYQIGFSGDAAINFPTLAFQPYFTATASNVGYGYWGHDLGGHAFTDESIVNDPELVLRWIQFGVFTPIFRTHATNDSRIERQIWKFPNFPDMLQAVKLRYSLFPYIYTMAREAYDTGISLCRPLYYEYPGKEEAYSFDDEYFFGNDILVAPIVEASDGGISTKTIWFPEGNWWSVATNELIEGPCTMTMSFSKTDIPYFYREGSIVPLNPASVKNVTEHPEHLIINVVAGQNGEGTLYEDEGDNSDYDVTYATTSFTQAQSGNKRTLTIYPREGNAVNLPAMRSYTVKIYNANPPEAVKINGVASTSYSYAPDSKCTTVELPSNSCASAITVEIEESLAGIADINVDTPKVFYDKSSDTLTAEFGQNRSAVELAMFNLTGAECLNRKYKDVSHFSEKLSMLSPSQMYLCKIIADNQVTVEKISK